VVSQNITLTRSSGKEIVALRGHNGVVWSATFSPDGSRVITASGDKTARIWDVQAATMSTRELVADACGNRLRDPSKLSRDEMRLAGYPDDMAEIDVCADVK
jgi:WD40 repeat protein